MLFNDNGYGVLRNIQNRVLDGRHIGVDLYGLNIGKLCEAYGIAYHKVIATRMLRPALNAALGSGRLSLIEIAMDEIGPYRIPFAGYALSN